MKAKEIAVLLKKVPNAEVLILVDGTCVNVVGVKETGMHRNAVTFVMEEKSDDEPA